MTANPTPANAIQTLLPDSSSSLATCLWNARRSQNFTSGATMRNLSAAILFLLLLAAPLAWSQTTTISTSSGPVSWDFAAVVGGTVSNVAGLQDMCPPAMCDNHDLTVVLPAPASSFYQTMTAKLTIKYTWNSTVPADLDVFAISP